MQCFQESVGIECKSAGRDPIAGAHQQYLRRRPPPKVADQPGPPALHGSAGRPTPRSVPVPELLQRAGEASIRASSELKLLSFARLWRNLFSPRWIYCLTSISLPKMRPAGLG